MKYERNMKLKTFVFIVYLVSQCSCYLPKNDSPKVFFLEAGENVSFNPESRRGLGFFSNNLRIYCYRGTNKTLSRLFQSVYLKLDIENEEFTQYEGSSPSEVQERFDEHRSIFSFSSLFSPKKTAQKINSFNQTCIGVDTIHPYTVNFNLIRVDFWRVIIMFAGLFVFLSAVDLSQNTMFYYITGVLIGIFASFLVALYFLGKLLPKRKMMYGVLIGGYAVGVYLLQFLWENLQLIMVSYQSYVFWYICITGIISFFVCYHFGPPKNERSKNLIKWGLQLVSVIMIFCSSHFEEATTAIILFTCILHYFPQSVVRKVRYWYSKKFPPKRRFLTNEEYFEEGVKVTTVALDQLREFCSSPECKQWKIVKKLKDPMRFASFIEGESHLTDSEVLSYEVDRQEDSSANTSEISEDEEEGFLEDEEEEERIEVNNYLKTNGTHHTTNLLNNMNRRSRSKSFNSSSRSRRY